MGPRLPGGSGPALRKGWDPTSGGWAVLSYTRALGLPLLPAEFQPPSIDAQETLEREVRAFSLLEAALRLEARALPREPWSSVLLTEKGHPTTLMLCDRCGATLNVLSYCGVVLCLPCWRKKAGRDLREVLLTLQVAKKQDLPGWAPFHLRFVTLTVRNGPDLEERAQVLQEAALRLMARVFWKRKTRGAITKFEVTWSPEQGWHPHLHVFQEGRYLEQKTLAKEWASCTRGEGLIVHIEDVGEDLGKAAKELSKYVTKPTAPTEGGKSLPLQAWPRSIRSELAAFLAGGPRTRYWCPTHSSASLEKCLLLQEEPGPGQRPLLCKGGLLHGRRVPPASFRVELTGYRRLRFYGSLREAHREAKEYSEDLENRCRECGVGKLRSLLALSRWAHSLQDSALLHLIQGHKSADSPWKVSPKTRRREPQSHLEVGSEGGWDPG